jgi:hypothetical protein
MFRESRESGNVRGAGKAHPQGFISDRVILSNPRCTYVRREKELRVCRDMAGRASQYAHTAWGAKECAPNGRASSSVSARYQRNDSLGDAPLTNTV